MKNTLVISFILCSVALFSQKNRKVLFVIADGISYDVIRDMKLKNVESIAKKGLFTEAHVGGEKNAYSETPTISAVGYNSLLTGTWVNKHNVWDNDIVAPNYNYPTIFKVLKENFPEKKTAIFSTWEDNRTKLLGSTAKETGYFQPDIYFDGYEKDEKNFPHDSEGHYFKTIDDFVVNNAVESVKESAPDLSWVYLEYPDEMGHRHGDSDFYYNAIRKVDEQIGRLYKAIEFREKKFNEEWLFIVTTDHGRDTFGWHHGGQSARERNTWILTNASNFNQYAKNQQPGIVDIYPTIVRFMGLKIDKDLAYELDGTPLLGDISAIEPVIKIENGKMKIWWTSLKEEGEVKIYLSLKDKFKTGGKDDYQLMKTEPVKNWYTEFDLPKEKPEEYYKVVLEFPHNTINRWVK